MRACSSFETGSGAMHGARATGARAAASPAPGLRWTHRHAFAAVVGACVAALLAPPAAADSIIRPRHYVVHEAPAEELRRDVPELPDLSPYTEAAVRSRIPDLPPARAYTHRMVDLEALGEFVSGTHKDRLAEWAARQTRNPVAIVVEGGRMGVRELAQQLDSSQLSETEPGVYLLRLPLLVQPGAALVIDDSVRELRLSEERGSFIVNDGHLFVLDTRITAWRERENGPALFRDGKDFRPFITSWGGAELYIVNSRVASLGYSASKGYGISLSQYSPGRQARLQRPPPVGWILNSEFVDNWFGYYCYEADDAVVIGNLYRDNIVYGVDPHDRSHRLIIANNEIHGTRKKHGLIISREVNDSWIFGNRIYDNALSGIVIDRNSVRNTVMQNVVYSNGSDGITVYESPDNLIWGNEVLGNGKHGIRVRNSLRAKLYHNVSVANEYAGVYGHVKDLTGTDRNLHIDPFEAHVSMVVVGGRLIYNGGGPVSIDKPLSLELYDVEMLAPTDSDGIQLDGVLHEYHAKVLDLLLRRKVPVLIEPVDPPSGKAEQGA